MAKSKSRVRKPAHLGLKRVAKGVAALGVCAVAYYAWSHRAPVLDHMEEFIAKSLEASVEHIMVEGVVYTDPVALREALNLEKGDTLVGFNAALTRQKVENLPWVKAAAVERKLPSTVRIDIYEHTPIARVETVDNGVWVMDKQGKLIDESDKRMAHLPILSGKKAAENASGLFALLASSPDLSKQLRGATYVGERRWNLGFGSGVVVQLPETHPENALELLHKLDRERKVLSMEGGMIDLRLEDRIVVRLPKDQKGKAL